MKKCNEVQYVMDFKERVFKIVSGSHYDDIVDDKVIRYEGSDYKAINQQFHELYNQNIENGTKLYISVCRDGEYIGQYYISEVEIVNEKYYFILQKDE